MNKYEKAMCIVGSVSALHVGMRVCPDCASWWMTQNEDTDHARRMINTWIPVQSHRFELLEDYELTTEHWEAESTCPHIT
jgi:hypothetical protein